MLEVQEINGEWVADFRRFRLEGKYLVTVTEAFVLDLAAGCRRFPHFFFIKKGWEPRGVGRETLIETKKKANFSILS